MRNFRVESCEFRDNGETSLFGYLYTDHSNPPLFRELHEMLVSDSVFVNNAAEFGPGGLFVTTAGELLKLEVLNTV